MKKDAKTSGLNGFKSTPKAKSQFQHKHQSR